MATLLKLFIDDHNQVLGSISEHFEIVKDIRQADAVILWNDVLPLQRGIIKLSKSLKKPTYVMQHGRKGSSKYYPPFRETILADKLLVWGEFDRLSLEEAGHPKERIKVVGSPVIKRIKERRAHQGRNIVYSPEHWDRPIEENIKTRDELRKIQGVNIITKLIDSPSHNPADYDNVVISNRESPDHLDKCIEVLQDADLVVGISDSTFELLAMAMDIPVVIMGEWEPKAFGGDLRYVDYRRVISDGAKRATISNLVEVVENQLENPDELRENRRKTVISEGGLGLDTSEIIKQEILNA